MTIWAALYICTTAIGLSSYCIVLHYACPSSPSAAGPSPAGYSSDTQTKQMCSCKMHLTKCASWTLRIHLTACPLCPSCHNLCCACCLSVQVIAKAVDAVAYLRSLGCEDIEFTAEDASRSDPDFVCQVTRPIEPLQNVQRLPEPCSSNSSARHMPDPDFVCQVKHMHCRAWHSL